MDKKDITICGFCKHWDYGYCLLHYDYGELVERDSCNDWEGEDWYEKKNSVLYGKNYE